ncbi:FAD-binding oxidoreductase [Anaerovorax sp. IOR16]|uniref:FAD-binding oxidoreductase n=1 Tax=Anaerovorax sp. IOR16 TaxID=2773458 RepID=UPI002ED0DA3B
MYEYRNMDGMLIKELKAIVGEDYVITEHDNVVSYLYDETEPRLRPAANEDCVVVKPRTTEEVSKIMALADKNKQTVVVRGGGTGLCGAAIPTEPSLILSMERFKEIIDLDDKNFIITLEAGVTLGEMNEFLKTKDVLYFPCHPGDESAQMGGLVVENAGGARAVKHGVMRNHIKGVELVLPNGKVMNLGGKLQKNNAGYDLLQLIIGSEGTLGIVTKVMLKLYPESKFTGTLLVSFDSYDQATEAATKTLQSGIIPLSIEYLDRQIALRSAEHLGEKWPLQKGNVDLMFILSEDSEDALFDVGGMIEEICEVVGAVESLIADSSKDQARILNIRSNTYTASKSSILDSMDITVPPAQMPALMHGFSSIAEKYHASIDTVGHIGDGNVHNNIYLVDGEIPPYYEEMKEELYKLAIQLGGSITGEHGIGKIRRKNLPLQFDEIQINLMRGVKELFDPNNILNPRTAIY